VNLLFWISYGLLWLIIAIQGFVLIELLHQVGLRHQEAQSRNDVLIKSGTLKAGEALPALSGISALSMQPVTWEDVLPHSSGMAIFLNTHCQSCRELAEKLPVFVEGISSTMSTVIIIEGTPQEAMKFIDEMQLDYQLVIIDEERTGSSTDQKWENR